MGFHENGICLSAYALAHRYLQTCSLPSPPHSKKVETIGALVVEGTAFPQFIRLFHSILTPFHFILTMSFEEGMALPMRRQVRMMQAHLVQGPSTPHSQ